MASFRTNLVFMLAAALIAVPAFATRTRHHLAAVLTPDPLTKASPNRSACTANRPLNQPG